VLDLSVFLPLQYTTVDEAEYCEFMLAAHLSFYEQENYHFSYLASHILMMYQIYLKLWQLSRVSPDRVIDTLTLAHFDKDDARPLGNNLRNIVENARSPMAFKIFKIEERVFVKVLTLLDCENYTPFKKAIDFRNILAHSSGLLTLRDAVSFEDKLAEIKALMYTIHKSSAAYLAEYFIYIISNRKYARPYREVEVHDDIEQLLISSFMLTPSDCEHISENLSTKTKLDRMIKTYLKQKAVEGGCEDE
jgi:hypothetical protein